MSREDDPRTARQIARGKQRKAGDRSARLANTLMKLAPPAIKKLEIDDDLREVLARARAVTSMIARRRAERTLAGELRRFDLVALAAQVARLHESGNADVAYFHIAEQWRARLIEEGIAALATFPGAGPSMGAAEGEGEDDDRGGAADEWPRLIAAARRERDTGKPPGAAKALFRHIVGELKLQAELAERAADPEGGDGDAADDDEPDSDADV